ncbi:MAG: DsbA family protein [Nitrosopumilaceae archaeon]
MKSVTNTSFVAIIVLGLFLSPIMLSVNAQDIMSPRQQMASGVAADDVVCKSGLVLMIRSTNGAATCVKSSTSMKLSDAGWGSIIIDDEEDETIDDETIDDETIANQTMGNATNEQIVELSEELSMGEEEGLPEETMEEESFAIGGIDLSMAAPVEGDEDAPITIIEFGDYQCPKCKAWFQNEKPQITSNYITKGIAKLYFLDSAWLGDDSIAAAQATYCADDQGKFIEYHSTLYNKQAGIQDGWANMDALKQFANDLELDAEMFNQCLDSGIYADRVSHNTEVGASLGVVGTPYFFIVGPEGDIKKIAGPQPSIVFDAAINSLS